MWGKAWPPWRSYIKLPSILNRQFARRLNVGSSLTYLMQSEYGESHNRFLSSCIEHSGLGLGVVGAHGCLVCQAPTAGPQLG